MFWSQKQRVWRLALDPSDFKLLYFPGLQFPCEKQGEYLIRQIWGQLIQWVLSCLTPTPNTQWVFSKCWENSMSCVALFFHLLCNLVWTTKEKLNECSLLFLIHSWQLTSGLRNQESMFFFLVLSQLKLAPISVITVMMVIFLWLIHIVVYHLHSIIKDFFFFLLKCLLSHLIPPVTPWM